MLMTAFVVESCSDDLAQVPHDVDFCVRAAWQNGLSGGKATRTLSATDIFATGTGDIEIPTADYPATINVHCSDGTDFSLSKGSAPCSDHNGYWNYTPSIIYKDNTIEHDNLTFTFTATIDDGDVLVGESNKSHIADDHLQFTLHHTKALLRFAFKVSEKYSKVRYIRVTDILLNDSPCPLADKVLTTDHQFIAYAYVDPTIVTTSSLNTIECTYDIYDRDAAGASHLTRKDVVARNTFTLNSLKDAGGSPVATITPGYYYDLRVTLNPDYLYVLSEHDNKHITIE